MTHLPTHGRRVARALLILIATLGIGLAAAPAQAKDIRSAGTLGLGLGSGTGPTGLSAKYYMSSRQALQVHVGSLILAGEASHIRGGVDYLFEMPKLAGGGVLDVAWNAGVGAAVTLDDDLGLAAAGVVGLELLFKPVPIDIVFEWRPTLDVLPGVGLDLIGFSGHIRWNF